MNRLHFFLLQKFFPLLFLLGLPVWVAAQDHKSTLLIAGTPYQITLQHQEDGEYRATVAGKNGSGEDQTESVLINPFTIEQCAAGLQQMIGILRGTALTPAETYAVRDKASVLFFHAKVAELTGTGSAPLAGRLSIKENIRGFVKKANCNEKKADCDSVVYALTVKNVQVEFLEGFIENIYVETVDAQGTPHAFSNVFGIGFSSKRNFDHATEVPLLEMGGQSKPNCPFVYLMGLNGVLNYVPELRISTRDYSPKDYQYSLIPSATPIDLYKEETQRLLEARVFTDLVGLDKESPNGLVQIEVAKRINTNTFRGLIFKHSGLARFLFGQGGGAFQYVVPAITLSKLEENNRYLPLQRQFDASSGTATGYTTALDLLQYQQFAAGMDFNLGYTENVAGKFNILIDAGFRFGRTAVRDSVTRFENGAFTLTGQSREFGVNTLQLSAVAKMHWLPDERFSVILSYRPVYLRALNADVQQVYYRSGEQGGMVPADGRRKEWPHLHKGSFLGTWEVLALVKPSTNGYLFGRYRISNQIGFGKHNFHQLQLGYSFYILKSNQKKTQNP
ncbi:MAG: hypothetical protein ICV83_22760 [Cytophagales bacterium]|nr:hypothetical protein [Cytophagales bacterium]